MANNKLTEMVFILDRSGSMSGLEQDTIGGYNGLIEKQKKEEFGWEFLFLGANIDAVETAANYGVSYSRSVTYEPDEVGTRKNFEAVCCTVSKFRSEKEIADDWKNDIAEYLEKKRSV